MSATKKIATLILATTVFSACSTIGQSRVMVGGTESDFCNLSTVPHTLDAVGAVAALPAGIILATEEEQPWYAVAGVVGTAVLANVASQGSRDQQACRAVKLSRDRAWAEWHARQDSLP